MKRISINIMIACLNLQAIAQVTINNSTQLVANGNIQMMLNDLSFVNDGNFVPGNGIVHLNGASNSTISGSSAISFYNLTINKSTNRVLLQRNIDVNGNISFSSGLLDLNNFNIMLSPSSLIIGEDEYARITGTNGGYIQITALLNNPVSSNPGNLGAIVTSIKDLGSTIIRRGHMTQSKTGLPDFSINRYYDIIPANNSNLDASLQFKYFNAELNGLTESNLWLWKSADLVKWFPSPNANTRDSIANFVLGKGIQNFSRWTLSGAYFPQSVYGPCNDKIVLRAWPNPFINDFNIGINANKDAVTILHLYDLYGNIIASRSIDLRAGSNLYNFSFPGLPAATYVVKIADNGCSTTVGKIIKLGR